MDVIELAKECGAEIDNFVSDTDKNLVGITFWGDELQAFAEAIKRDLLDVGEVQVAWGHKTATGRIADCIAGCDLPDDYFTIPLFTAEQMAHSRSEAVRDQWKGWQAAIAEAQQLMAYLSERPLHQTETGVAREVSLKEVQNRLKTYQTRFAEAIRNQGE